MKPWQRTLKRVFDVVFAATVLVVLSPLLLLIAALVKLDSRGPVFFVARRCGQHRRPFDFYKFRTMVVDAPQRGSAMFTTAGDARVTRLGRYLRLFKLDELPQFVNVLKGDMSVVGPRPEVFDVVDHHYQDRWDEILTVQPGLTCLLQVEVFPDFSVGHQGVEDPLRYYVEHELRRKTERDLAYVRRASLRLDAWIVLQTLYCILFKSWQYLGRRPDPAGAEAAAQEPAARPAARIHRNGGVS